MVEIRAVGGYGEVGKNMTCLRVDNEIIILDMGLHIPNYINLTEDDSFKKVSEDALRQAKAIPDDLFLRPDKDMVKAIVPTHAHLDHIGAIPYLAGHYGCPVICTPYTAEVIRTIAYDENIRIKNKIYEVAENSVYKISKDLKIEFIRITHSIPQASLIAIHTKYGVIVYANDFKFDNHPIIGTKPNYKRLKELGSKDNVLALVVDSLYAKEYKKTPSEKIAREMLKEVLLEKDSRGKAVIITTFSSHLARLKSIIETAKKLDRKIVMLGRSLAKYVGAGERIGLVNFSKDAEMIRFSKRVKKRIKSIIKEGTENYVLIVTGHQGEPQAILSRMVESEVGFKFRKGDHVIFSCTTIPTAINIENREQIEDKLKRFGVKIFKDVQVSGHGGREDIRELIEFLKPKHIIPGHSEQPSMEASRSLAHEMDYDDDHIHLMHNGDMLKL